MLQYLVNLNILLLIPLPVIGFPHAAPKAEIKRRFVVAATPFPDPPRYPTAFRSIFANAVGVSPEA